jgi:Tol biopolymer transport system component/DNA-binding winged helix-turn-helix (wHTH) protein
VPQREITSGLLRFGVFEVDVARGELRKRGLKLKIQDQPFRILAAMLESPGEIVTREELVQRLWPDGTFVDFDRGLNAAVAKLRQVLQDSAETPRYVETVARRGYRFLAPVEMMGDGNGKITLPPPPSPERDPTAFLRWWPAIAALALVAAILIWIFRPATESRLEQITHDPGLAADPALSPDGKLLAYASDREGGENLNIWVKQLVPGGKSIELTHDAADAHQPSFSPDGSKIAYRSEVDGGGIYVIAAIGGEAVRLVPGGRNPRFSPDGRSIAYWAGAVQGSAPEADASGSIFVVPASGGVPKRLGPNLPPAGFPIWAANSTQLLVFANPRTGIAVAGADWWTVPVDGGPARPTAAFSMLRSQGFSLPYASSLPRASSWNNDTVTFSAQLGDGRNIWRIPIRESDGQVAGKAERLTSGTTLEVYPSELTPGSLVFASLNQEYSVWTQPVDADRGVVTGEFQRLTDGTNLDVTPSISADGRKLTYGSVQPGSETIWLKDLQTRTQTALGTGAGEWHPVISRDGSMIAYTVDDGKNDHGLYVTPAVVNKPAHVGDGRCWIFDWTPDQHGLVFRFKSSDPTLRRLDLQSGAVSTFMAKPGVSLFQSKFAPDGNWLAFEGVFTSGAAHVGDSRVFITEIHNGSPGPDWILVGDEHGWTDKPRWSPDGNTLYFISHRDGFRCVWGQRLNPATKHPVAPPFPIHHFHKSRLSPMNVGLALMEIDVAKDAIVMSLGELTGNIWRLTRR